MPAGRPTIFSEEIIEKTKAYIDACEDEDATYIAQESEKYKMYKPKLRVKLPSIDGLAYHLGIHKDTIYQWEEIHTQFSDLINMLRNKQAERLINMGLSGDYNPYIAKALLAKHGYADKQEIDQKTTIEDKRIDTSKLTDDELRTLAAIQRKSGTGPEAS